MFLFHFTGVETKALSCYERLSVTSYLVQPVPFDVGKPVDQARAVAGGDTVGTRTQTSCPRPGADGYNLQEVGIRLMKEGA